MEFVETRVFIRMLPGYMNDAQFGELQQGLIKKTELGDKIPGSGGIRKARWEAERHGKGKRGGLRIIYFYHITDSQIFLLAVYRKGEVDDLTVETKPTVEVDSNFIVRTRGNMSPGCSPDDSGYRKAP